MQKNLQPLKQYSIIGYNQQRSKRMKRLKILAVILAVVLVAAGVLLIVSVVKRLPGAAPLFYTKTPTATVTNTPTATPEYTETLTLTPTPLYTDTPEPTATPDGPFLYTVQEGDNCWYLAVDKFGVDLNVFMAINNLKDCNIRPGDRITIPSKDQKMPEK